MIDIKQFIPEGYCLHCRGCCRFAAADSVWQPAVSAQEQQSLGLAQEHIPLINNPSEGNFICSFLNTKTNACSRYLQRPWECRLYPFLINRNQSEIFLSVDLNCPFAREQYLAVQFKEFLEYLKSVVSREEFITMLSANKHLIGQYETVVDLFRVPLCV